MAAFTSGSNWNFKDIPGAWSQDDFDAQVKSENERSQQNGAPPKYTSTTEETRVPPKKKKQRTHYPPRTCRICLDTVLPTFHSDESSFPLPASMRSDDIRVTYESPPGDGGRLLRPCRCKGSAKYVHEECLAAWRMQDPLQKRNYWECPTCRYKYRLQRLTWGAWLGSTSAQLALTLFIFFVGMFVLGFVADPIINMYLDPVSTIASAGGPTGSLIYEDEPPTWTEHFAKGLASIGLLGFAKFLLGLSPWYWFRSSGMRAGRQGTGQDRLQQISWITLAIGIGTVLYALWKGVRAFSRRTLEKAGERVLDVPGDSNDDDEDD